MFVSSYSTYINTNSSERTTKDRFEKSKEPASSFESKLSQSSVLESKNAKDLPINYISNYKAFSNKQKLQDQFQNTNKIKYTQINSVNNAKIAYADNSKIFSFFLEPKATQNQTPKVDKKLPNDMQKLQEHNMRHTMVNTYQENDKYYQITAA